MLSEDFEDIDLYTTLLKVYNKINDANFEDALTNYYLIVKKAEKTKLDTEFKKIYEIYKESVILYLVIKESIIIANNKNMDLLKERLDYIYFSKKNIIQKIKSEKLINYFEKNYHYLLGFYMYNLYKKKFMQEIENIYYFMNAGWIEKATDHYNKHLLKYYNKLVAYGDYRVRNILYNAITNLSRELKLNSLKQQAYSEIASYTFSNLKRTKIKEKVNFIPRNIPNQETLKFDKKKFNKLHNLIKSNQPEEALNLYNSLLQQNI